MDPSLHTTDDWTSYKEINFCYLLSYRYGMKDHVHIAISSFFYLTEWVYPWSVGKEQWWAGEWVHLIIMGAREVGPGQEPLKGQTGHSAAQRWAFPWQTPPTSHHPTVMGPFSSELIERTEKANPFSSFEGPKSYSSEKIWLKWLDR